MSRARRTPVVPAVLSALFTTALLMSGTAHATTDLNAALLNGVRPDARDGRLYTEAPQLALFGLQTDAAPTDWLKGKIVLSGWGKLDPGQPRNDIIGAANADAAFVEGVFGGALLGEKRLTLRLGRQAITGGGARNLRVDGLSADANIWNGIGASAFAGVVVNPTYVPQLRANFATGARAYYRFNMETEVGASYIMVRDGAGFAREDLGLDGRWRIIRELTVSGYGLYSIVGRRLAEGDVRAVATPISMLQLTAAYRHTAPDLFLSQMSIFTVFAQQQRDELGGEAWLQPHDRVTIDGNAYWLKTDAGSGYRAGGRVSLLLGERKQTTFGVESRVLRTPFYPGGPAGPTPAATGLDGYVEARVFAATRIVDRVIVSLDFDEYFLAKQINRRSNSFTTATSVTYIINPAWRVMVQGSAGVTPFLAQHFEIMGRATYTFTDVAIQKPGGS